MIQLKMCGFQSIHEIEKAIQLPIDALGFILVPDRKRTVKKEKIKAMIQRVPNHILTVGVLQNPSLTEVEEWLSLAPFQAIQLHGEESTDFCRLIKERYPVKVIKTFHAEQELQSIEEIEDYAQEIDFVLLDSSVGKQKGGTGQPFNWNIIPAFYEICDSLQLPLWVAGGLKPENVSRLLHEFPVDGVDVSSGIEHKGQKDLNKMRQFVERVRLYEKINH